LLEDFDISKPVLYFFGTERDGLSEEILKRRWFSKIRWWFYRKFEHFSFGGNHHSNRSNRRNSNIDWHLSETEILEKRLALKNSIKDIKRIEARYFEEH
jgi:tRNA (guanosine-2'-O-)-methyltransferase